MNIHKNARLTPALRAERAPRAARPGANLSALAREYRVSRQTATKWRDRGSADRSALLGDRSSRPHRRPHRLARHRRPQIQRRRTRRWSSCRIASHLHLPLAAVVREQRRLGLAHVPRLEPPHPVLRNEWPRAGDLLHLDVKKLGKIGRVGHRMHGDRTKRVRGIGWEYVHVAIDDCTRVPYAEVLADETGPTTAAFVQRAPSSGRAGDACAASSATMAATTAVPRCAPSSCDTGLSTAARAPTPRAQTVKPNTASVPSCTSGHTCRPTTCPPHSRASCTISPRSANPSA